MSLCGFTFGVVTWVSQIAGHAFALIGKEMLMNFPFFFLLTNLECSTFVCARLRTRSGNVTLVNVFACLVAHKLIAGFAVTVKARLCVDTLLRTSAVVQFTFVTTAFIDRLVFRIGAILNGIAYFCQGNAHSTATIEFRFAVACSFWCS